MARCQSRQQLQTDLVKFAEEASAFSKGSERPEARVKLKSDKGLPGPRGYLRAFGSAMRAVRNRKSLQKLGIFSSRQKPKWRGPMHEKDGLDSEQLVVIV